MSYRFTFHPEFDQDVAEIENWYERKDPGVGLKFTRAVRDELEELPDKALLYRVRDRRSNVRCYYMRTFPYQILYRVNGARIHVAGIFHVARHDRHWRKRAKEIDADDSLSAT